MTAREPAIVRRRLQLLDDPAQADDAAVSDKSEDAWVVDFISRLAGTLRDIGIMRRKGK